jgi:archaeal flagellin FlaB
MFKRFLKGLQTINKGQKGITGLETAIILIAFVTVASVLGYSVLSAGIFSAEKGKAAVYQGLNQAQASMEVKGSVYVSVNATACTNVTFTLASVLNDQSVDMTAPPDNTLVINYTDSKGLKDTNLTWTATHKGKTPVAENMLGPSEQMMMDVTLPDNTLGVYDSFTLQIIPAKGAAITIQRSLPGLLADGTIDVN